VVSQLVIEEEAHRNSVDHIEEQAGKVAAKVTHKQLEKGEDSEAKFFAEVG
jgi:hypothetical protein